MSDAVEATGLEEVILRFDELGSGAQARLEAAVGKQAADLAAVVRDDKLSGGVLNVRSGTLRNSIHVEMSSDFTGVLAVVGTDVVYAAIHEYGGVIVPKVAKALRFMIGDQVIHAKSVTMPERSFLRSTLAEREGIIREALLAAVVGRA